MFSTTQKLTTALTNPVRWATKMVAGVTKNKKDSAGKRLGIKLFGGQEVRYNQILVRQRGFKWSPGYNVFVGKDHTLHSAAEGYVWHEWNPEKKRTVVSVVPMKLPERPKLNPVFCYHPELQPELAENNPPPSEFPVKQKTKQQKQKHQKEIGRPLVQPKYSEPIKIDNPLLS